MNKFLLIPLKMPHNVFGFICALCLITIFTELNAESTNTTLTNPDQIKVFNEVTGKIRCICLPSLPIKSCSFNNCRVSAYIKMFFENRIKKNETADEIVNKTVNGFGEEILNDPVILMFLAEGNEDLVKGLINGFGQKILATPDSKLINTTLILGGILGLLAILFYLKKKRTSPTKTFTPATISEKEKYLKEAGEI